MRATFTDITQIVNPRKFQTIQDDIALATDLAIITVDYMGKPLTKHSNCSEFCKNVRSSKYGSYCEKCNSHGGLEAARNRKPFIYICHAGIVDFAIPIIVNDLYLGAFMAGQVILSQLDSLYAPERILHNVNLTFDPMKDVSFRESYNKLPIMRLDKIMALANMLLHIGNYCVNEAGYKALITSTPKSQEANQFDKTKYLNDDDQNMIYPLHKHIKNETYLIIQPALTYIKKHPKEKITLERMAALCNISPSYFSKLFAKENLGCLSDYVNQVKIERAKEHLIETNWPIRTVAENVGFEDCGYFIKVFKRNTNKTPLEYRNDYAELSK
ncbi:PocR ligand-binding domain-containing protein [Konateibacter massiliensis]|uniref:PocR ligand-binding domain-containing protein n=1 Tax=Konateibacter massiliensis TaxID=2002841 RepID=UPI000C14CEF8|nr:PocR ligand-binding domain-containing protein [Konateibacter massiliensis]